MDINNLFNEGKISVERIIIIGPPGSGKTFLTEKLEKFFDGMVIHIDELLWQNRNFPLSDGELCNKLKSIIKNEKWLIDGTYLKFLPERMERASLIIYLDIPINVCISSINERRLNTKIIYGCEDYEGFIKYVKKYDSTHKPKIVELISKYACKKIVHFKSREEVNEFISQLDLQH